MDVLELLKTDHDKIKRLFMESDTTTDRKAIEQLYASIKSELESHMYAEESAFYPPFRRYPELSSLVETLYNEHQEFRSMMQRIDKMITDSESIISELQQLNEAFLHHVRDEEDNLFIRVRKLIKRPEREQLGRHVLAVRNERQAA